MNYLNKEIESRTKIKKSKSLVKRQISCGTFQDFETLDFDNHNRAVPRN
ncbi:MAG: hypothetical protein NXH90_14445 [Flavobacteriaceae bacterium]|nr:hypothetical protein [Flavobacteriaceae bacterium]